MKQLRNTVIRAGLEALYFSGAHFLLRPIFAGVGAIFMLHHVRPRREGEFQPNHHLEVEPEFLRAVLAHLRALDVELVTMNEVHQRLSERNFERRFACFTLDDGYRDNRDFALPVMREFDAPLTVYVASDFAEGTGRLWWIGLERAIDKASSIEVPIGGVPTSLDTSTPAAMNGCGPCLMTRSCGAKSPRYVRAMASTRPRLPATSACPGTNSRRLPTIRW
jgi:hypothetical protein